MEIQLGFYDVKIPKNKHKKLSFNIVKKMPDGRYFVEIGNHIKDYYTEDSLQKLITKKILRKEGLNEMY